MTNLMVIICVLISVTTRWIGRCGIAGGQTIWEQLTKMQQIKVSHVPSWNSKKNNGHGRGRRLNLPSKKKKNISNRTVNARLTSYWGASVQPLLLWNTNNYYTFRKCEFVALGTQREMLMLHIVICGRSGFFIFFHIISHTAQFSKKKVNIKCVFWFSVQICLQHFSF